MYDTQLPTTSAVLPGEPGLDAAEIGSLLRGLDGGVVVPVQTASPPRQMDVQLAVVRLGMAGALFTALRCKHAATAEHCLRVAATVSAWATVLKMPPHQRDVLEAAALLHDVGVMAVPDQILHKPSPLNEDEKRIIDAGRRVSVEILRQACAEPEILDIVENVGARYDGLRPGYRLIGDQIPVGARMIAILEAFDAMISEQVYRAAISQERAFNELFACAGTQFDPDLVKAFAELATCDQGKIRQETASRWLERIDPEVMNSFWAWSSTPKPAPQIDEQSLYRVRLLDNMHDPVIFVDLSRRIIQWNHGAERLTGISAASVRQRHWNPAMLGMRDDKGNPVDDRHCPVVATLSHGSQSMLRLIISGRNGQSVTVDSHTIPVAAENGDLLGVVLHLHDASSETSLEQRCQNLHEKATRDPLTQVANRAEFDRVHTLFIRQHEKDRVPCSLTICDLDRFKKVNDTFGHQAGDDAIRSVATLLKNSCRSGDLVARYGGEEFVILYADCDITNAARRAEQIRKALAQVSQPRMNGGAVTASFGVTEIQPGDTAETMLRRADRALLQAKSQGRNMVVQLGAGADAEEKPADAPAEAEAKDAVVLQQEMVTPVPVSMAVEKLRGFIADHNAQVVSTDENRIQLTLVDQATQRRRLGDRPTDFLLDITLSEEPFENARGGSRSMSITRTRIHVVISPRRNRDRRRTDVADKARQILSSVRCYLMAVAESPPSPAEVPEAAQSWLGRMWPRGKG
jgi:diguanylate cyclase (GGDEF)-like protein/PAS domain S-box-containing protein/putative nucleotidyltransferase with HDIG domain